MEDDDEFGDLYTDVLRPYASPVQPRADASTSLPIRPIDPDVNSDDETIYGDADLKNSVSKSASLPGIQLTSSIQEKPLQTQPESGRFDSNSEMGVGVRLPENGLDFIVEDDDLNIVVEENENKDTDDLVEKDDNLLAKPDKMYGSAERGESAVEKMGSEHTIPGLSGNFEDHKGPNFEDEWDSDESEDDLQIVLNDSNGLMGMMERMPGFDGEGEVNEAGELLVMVADNGDVGHPHQADEHEWKGEEVGSGADWEKEPVDAAKAGGGPVKIGYSNQLYHHSFHSQFKYVRPGAAPSPTPGGIQGQVRPPISMGPGGGRGRGDWQPRGPVPMQKGLHPGNGMPAWGPNTAGRGYGSGLDFTLPSHKTIFEVDIDGFEEKPWRHPGIEISAFFNFGFIEDSWKDYCKQLELLRLGKTMQGKIHVYESDRTKQDYDRDLPPELAAAVGNQDFASENANAGIAGECSSDIARSSARVPPSVPIGRPIPVETGSDERRERLPSIDTRRPRMHDSDAIIEIVCQRSNDDDVAEQPESDSGGEYLEGPDDIVDLRRDDAERINSDDDVDGEKQLLDNQSKSSESNKDRSMADGEADGDDDVNGRSIDTVKDDIITNDANEDRKLLMPPPKKQISVEQLSQENDDREEDSKASRKSIDDISRGSSLKRRAGDEDNERTKNRHHITGKGREDSLNSSRGGPHLNSSSLRRHMKSENTDWRKGIRERGADYDQDKVGSRQRDRDVAHSKRKERGEKDEVTYNHRESESASHRKRERNDDVNHYVSQKKEEGSSNQKERGRDEGHSRNKQSREDNVPRREKEETRLRPIEDKKRAIHSKGRDDYKGSGRENRSENVRRQSDQLKRRDRVEDGGHEKPSTSDEPRQEGSRKGKESESREQSSVMPSKRNRDEQTGRIIEMVNPRGITKHTNVKSDSYVGRQSSRKHSKEAISDDNETATDSRRGRSKLERWTKDFKELSSSNKSNKGLDTQNTSGEAPLTSKKVEEDDKDAGDGVKNNAKAKAVDDNNSNIHLDTVERLKKRSERFKLPMPSDKEALAIKKIVKEPLPSASQQTESHPDSEGKIKPERPARKRRWTGN